MTTTPSTRDAGTAPEAGGDDPARPARPARPNRSGLTALVLRLHFYAGLLVAPFLLVAAASGVLYAASVQVEKVVYDHELYVPVGDERLPLQEQIRAARAEHPEGTLNAVRPAAEPDATTRVLLDVPGLGPSQRLAVFVDPYTAEVRGAREVYGSSGALPLRWWIDELHRNLHLGDLGRNYSELAASWLAVITLGGVVLWLTRRRTGRRARRTLWPERGLGGRRGVLTWHGTTGLWIAVVLCFLSVTGLTWSQHAGSTIAELRATLSWETPAVTAGSDGPDHEGHGGHGGHGAHEEHVGDGGTAADVGPDRVLSAAREAGLDDAVEIVFPAGAGGDYTVTETDRRWPAAQDAVAVASATGEVTDTVRFEDWPLAAKLAGWGTAAHMGLLFGIPNQLVLMALGCALVAVIVLGYRMWWLRRPTGAGALTWGGRPPRRGTWRRVRPSVLLPVLAVTAFVGYHLPLLGLSLLAFLAVDAVLGHLRRRDGSGRSSPAEPETERLGS